MVNEDEEWGMRMGNGDMLFSCTLGGYSSEGFNVILVVMANALVRLARCSWWLRWSNAESHSFVHELGPLHFLQ